MGEPAKTLRAERPSFQTSVETRLLYQRLILLAVGEVISYAKLSALISQDVQREGYGALSSARKLALRDNRIITDAINNIGIKRLSDTEAAHDTTTFAKIRRAADRRVKVLMATDDAELPQEARISRDAQLSALALNKLLAKPKTLDRIAASITIGQLPIARTLALFQGPKPTAK